MEGRRDPKVTLPERASNEEEFAGLLKADREAALARMSEEEFALFHHDWNRRARPGQCAPDGDWLIWLIMAGRGFGKTRAGAEWVRGLAARHDNIRIALVGATMGEVRSVMVEGASGLMNIGPPSGRPKFEASLRRLRWDNGAQAILFSAAEPESLRGAEHHFAWCDEIGKWPKGVAAWDNMMMGLRAGIHPRVVATTTPRAVPLVRRLTTEQGVVQTRGSTLDNRLHLARPHLDAMLRNYGGTLLGRQELDGELIEEVEGALWRRPLIEGARIREMAVERRRVVIGVDPPAGADPGSDACGIVVVALGEDGRGYVLADASIKGASPEGWARAVATAAERWSADRVVAEVNNGGAMVESVLRAAEHTLPVKSVHASHNKATRAEPVVALYERGRVAHVGAFPALEDEMCGIMAGGGYEGPGRSPDRADALVWALTELMLGKQARPGVRSISG
jgi:phage terminase large subunit-like protein